MEGFPRSDSFEDNPEDGKDKKDKSKKRKFPPKFFESWQKWRTEKIKPSHGAEQDPESQRWWFGFRQPFNKIFGKIIVGEEVSTQSHVNKIKQSPEIFALGTETVLPEVKNPHTTQEPTKIGEFQYEPMDEETRILKQNVSGDSPIKPKESLQNILESSMIDHYQTEPALAKTVLSDTEEPGVTSREIKSSVAEISLSEGEEVLDKSSLDKITLDSGNYQQDLLANIPSLELSPVKNEHGQKIIEHRRGNGLMAAFVAYESGRHQIKKLKQKTRKLKQQQKLLEKDQVRLQQTQLTSANSLKKRLLELQKIVRSQSELSRAKTVLSKGEGVAANSREEKLFAADRIRSGDGRVLYMSNSAATEARQAYVDQKIPHSVVKDSLKPHSFPENIHLTGSVQSGHREFVTSNHQSPEVQNQPNITQENFEQKVALQQELDNNQNLLRQNIEQHHKIKDEMSYNSLKDKNTVGAESMHQPVMRSGVNANSASIWDAPSMTNVSDKDVYRQAVSNGFWGAIFILVLAIMAWRFLG